MKKYIIFGLIIALSVMLFTALDEINKHDLSTQKASTCNLKVKSPIHLVTYADGDVYVANAKVLAESALNNCVDVVYMYRKEHLDKEFVEKNKNILSAKRGAGYWLWKPYLMLKTLKELPENSVVVYLDSGFKIIDQFDKFINEIDGYDILLVDNVPHTNKEYTKRDLFRIMNMDNQVARDAGQLSGGMFVMRNTQRSKEFLQKWLEIAEIPGAIDDSSTGDEYPEFKAHRHDQSILSVLYLQNSEGIKVMHIYDLLDHVYLHRRNDMRVSLFMLDYAAKDWPSMKKYLSRMPLLEKLLYGLLYMQRKFVGN